MANRLVPVAMPHFDTTFSAVKRTFRFHYVVVSPDGWVGLMDPFALFVRKRKKLQLNKSIPEFAEGITHA